MTDGGNWADLSGSDAEWNSVWFSKNIPRRISEEGGDVWGEGSF